MTKEDEDNLLKWLKDKDVSEIMDLLVLQSWVLLERFAAKRPHCTGDKRYKVNT